MAWLLLCFFCFGGGLAATLQRGQCATSLVAGLQKPGNPFILLQQVLQLVSNPLLGYA